MSKLLIILMLLPMNSYALEFSEAISIIGQHSQVESEVFTSKAIKEVGGIKGSWGDPKIKLSAKNFPKDSLEDDQTPMTGIGLDLSQKISLSTKYGNINRSYESMSKAKLLGARNKKERLLQELWSISIKEKRLVNEISILKENFSWINKILKVSKRLYANGKASQQALLDIQIRKSELESELSNKVYEKEQLLDNLGYLLGQKANTFNFKSVPWKVLEEKTTGKLNDFKELSLEENLRAKDYSLTAAKQNFLPDLNVSIGYTKRSNIDNKGDFVSASVSFPLPFSSVKYSGHGKAVNEKYSAERKLKDYKKKKNSNIKILKREISKVSRELEILRNKTIRFARNSRKITSKSYGLGNTTYIELLQSELKLQKILLKKVLLESRKSMGQVALKFSLGEKLHE